MGERNVNSLRWEGVVYAVTPVVNGGESLGNVNYLRREKCFTATRDGVFDVPVISGNAVRGVLRDVAADLWWEDAGNPSLTTALQHMLWSGGALTKHSGAAPTGEKLSRIKDLCPVVGVFGAAGGGRMVGGRLSVGRMLPVTEETVHLIPKRYAEQFTSLVSVWDVTQLDWYSRTADSEGNSQMRYAVESFVAGVPFYTRVYGTWLTDKEASFLCDVMGQYFEGEFHVGGMKRVGYGTLDWGDVEMICDAPVQPHLWKRGGVPLSVEENMLLARLD